MSPHQNKPQDKNFSTAKLFQILQKYYLDKRCISSQALILKYQPMNDHSQTRELLMLQNWLTWRSIDWFTLGSALNQYPTKFTQQILALPIQYSITFRWNDRPHLIKNLFHAL